MSDPAELSAAEAVRRIRAGTLRAEALMEACLARIAAREEVTRAFAYFDPAGLRAPRPGKLHGLPVGVKDVLDTADMPSEYGSPIWAGHRPRADAAAIAWTRAAGGVVMGKTVTTEFATRKPGPTANPHNPAHTPGGSSSGSAAGVADFFFPLAFGTQTAGSILRPAAFCGVVGYKPSFGTIPRLGMKVMSENLDTIGSFSRTVADAALFVGAVANRDLGDPDRKPEVSPRIGLCRSPVWDKAQPETHVLWDRVAAAVERAGAKVVERALPPAYAGLVEGQPIVMHAESARSMGWELLAHRSGISEVLLERLEWGLGQSANLEEELSMFKTLQDHFPEAMEGIDILLTPAAPGEAPAGLDWTGDPAFNAIWTALHVPCVSVPAGAGPNGLPLGIQVVGRRSDDRATLAWSQWVAAAVAN
jgi:Asp-tRNA(Asn)/Glu-tRNA(Gln) amidotransferase A subunit family amidase